MSLQVFHGNSILSFLSIAFSLISDYIYFFYVLSVKLLVSQKPGFHCMFSRYVFHAHEENIQWKLQLMWKSFHNGFAQAIEHLLSLMFFDKVYPIKRQVMKVNCFCRFKMRLGIHKIMHAIPEYYCQRTDKLFINNDS